MKRILIALLACAGLRADTLISRATGNLTAAGTWVSAEAGASASQTTRTATSNTTAAWQGSTAFTCTNNDVITAVVMSGRRLTTTGTVTMGISRDNGVSYEYTVVVNASDIPASDTNFAFSLGGSPVTCDGGNDYKIGIISSSAGNAAFYRATGTNWYRILATDAAPGAVAAGDALYVVGDCTAAATCNAYVVTIDDTGATDLGAIEVGDRGTLTAATSAATPYTLKVSGDLTVWASGNLYFGTVGNAMPADSSLEVTMDCGSNVQYGIILKDGSAFVARGNPVTYTRTFLAADAAANATSLTTADSTGWASGDLIAVASTTRTATQSEQGDLNGAASGTTLTVHGFAGAGGGLANAHSGTAPTRAEVINLTRNVKLHGASAANQTYLLINSTANVDAQYMEFYWMGSSTTQKRGISALTTTGTVSIQYCSEHDFVVAVSTAFVTEVTSTYTGVVYSNNVTWSIAGRHFWPGVTTGTWTANNNVFMKNTDALTPIVDLLDVGGTFTNNTMVSGTGTLLFFDEVQGVTGTVSGNTVHSGASYGVQVGSASNAPLGIGSVISSTTVWRMNSGGFQFTGACKGTTINGLTAFGNTTANLQFNDKAMDCTVRTAVLNGDTTFATGYGIYFNSDAAAVKLEGSNLGTASGILVTHSTGDIGFVNNIHATVNGENVTLGSATPIYQLTNAVADSWVSINRYGGTAGDHRIYRPHGSTLSEATIVKAGTAERMYPEIFGSGTYGPSLSKYASALKYTALDAGDTITIKVWVYKSVVGDGEAYGGNQPRLMVKANPSIGIDADTVLATMTADTGAWEQLSGTVTASGDAGIAQVYVDCDGTTGSVVVDSWSAQGAKGQDGQGYWLFGQPGPGFAASSPVSYGSIH